MSKPRHGALRERAGERSTEENVTAYIDHWVRSRRSSTSGVIHIPAPTSTIDEPEPLCVQVAEVVGKSTGVIPNGTHRVCTPCLDIANDEYTRNPRSQREILSELGVDTEEVL